VSPSSGYDAIPIEHVTEAQNQHERREEQRHAQREAAGRLGYGPAAVVHASSEVASDFAGDTLAEVS
jgi:hypothetical protein